MYKFDCDNSPNPAKFLESYRYLGYDNYSAIADIVDNSFDAKADNIWITVNQVKDQFRITVCDDGTGMDEDTLRQAYRLGAMTERDPSTDLGKYGVGSASASLSIARRTTIYTRAEDLLFLTKVVDLDYAIEKNTFDVHFMQATKVEQKEFEEMCCDSETGTVIILENCDNIQNKNVTQFKNHLRKHLGEVFRMFLDAGKKIYINGEKINAVDPLLVGGWSYGDERYETTIWSDEEYEVNLSENGEKRLEKIRIRMALLPLLDRKLWDKRWPRDVAKPSIPAQGFYVMRNNREIAAAETLLSDDVFKKHNDFNRFRAEIFFPATIDSHMGVNFTKRKLNLSQSVRDQLETYLAEQLKTVRKVLKRESGTKSKDVKVSFRESEDVIEQKQKLLIRKKRTEEQLKREIEEQKKKQAKKSKKEIEEEQRKLLDEAGKPKTSHFDLCALGRNGVFFETEQIGHTLVVKYNMDHPFYTRFYAEKDKSTQNDLNFILYSYCLAKRSLQPEQAAIVEQMEGLWSLNLKALLD